VQKTSSLLESLASLPEPERKAILGSFTEAQAREIYWDWRGCAARSEQLPPGSDGAALTRADWRYWFVQAGRGWGKTRTGAETVREWVRSFEYVNLIGATSDDARDIMIEGESGIMACCPAEERPTYRQQLSRLDWPSGAKSLIFTAVEPERLRGKQHMKLWADELGAWRYAEAWDQAMFGMRLGINPQAVITTTPKPTEAVKRLLADPHTVVTRGRSYDNRANLAPAFFDAIIRKYEGTRLGRQELEAELLEDVPGALWTRKLIDSTRGKSTDVQLEGLVRIVVAIDPAVTSNPDSDETGIIVAALTRGWHVLILDDLSCRETPLGWAKVAIAAYRARRADRIVAEVNNGGDLVAGNIRGVDPNVSVRTVRATRGKYIRAEPVAALYEQGRVHHIGSFPELEDQMCGWTPQGDQKSPDRLDALVWAVTELLIDIDDAPIGLAPAGEFRISSI
jgi:phage terminase large subunit-like protein